MINESTIELYMNPDTYVNEDLSKQTNIETSKQIDQMLNKYSNKEMNEIDTYFFKESDIKERAEREQMNFNVVSFGGCSSNYIKSKCSGKYRITRIWGDKFCHYLRPLHVSSMKYCIYIYRSPLHAVMSQWRRKICKNFYKLRDETYLHLPFSFENLFFLMYTQMKNFKETNTQYKKIMIKYETAHKYQDELTQLLNVKFDFKARECKNISLNIDLNGKYYLKALEMYNSLPEYSVS